MSTMNKEVYAALIEAGAGEDKASAAAVSITEYQTNINDIKSDLKVLKWGMALVIAAEVVLM